MPLCAKLTAGLPGSASTRMIFLPAANPCRLARAPIRYSANHLETRHVLLRVLVPTINQAKKQTRGLLPAWCKVLAQRERLDVRESNDERLVERVDHGAVDLSRDQDGRAQSLRPCYLA